MSLRSRAADYQGDTAGHFYLIGVMPMFEQQRDLFDETPKKPMTWREQYNEVIGSRRWKRLRERFLKKHDNKCNRCGWQKTKFDKSRTLELHHNTYERLGCELDTDLELVCSACHVKADRERAKRSRKRSESALYDAQFGGWASKVYGDDFHMAEDQFMHEKFDEWRQRKEEY